MNGLPDFMIIGAMKCATSTLHEQLARQAGIFMTTPKEPNFFSDPDAWANGMDWYRALFARAGPGDLKGESSTHYTMLPTYPDAVPRIGAVVGRDTKFIYVMRDPVERLVSHWIHDWSEGVVDGSVDAAIDARPELIDYGRYAFQLQPYLDAFGPTQIMPVFFEHLVDRPQAELTRICTFLGHRGRPVWHDTYSRTNPSDKRMRLSPLVAWFMTLPGSEAIRRAFIPEQIRERVKSRWRIESRPGLSPRMEARVHAIFDEDLATLGRWLALDLTSANFKDVAKGVMPTWSPEAIETFAGSRR